MPTVELDHPTGSVLTAYSLGQISEPDLAGIDGHLAECAVCRQVVEGVAPDTLVALLRSADTDVVNGEAPMGATPPAALDGHPRYRVGELLGVGGMGAVYKAEHLLMERPVALKVLKRELIDRPATMERFRREVRAAARLTHPNIVAAFDAEQVEDVHFLVMEYVEGVSLAKRSAEQGPLPVAEACDYIRQAALGLQHAHSCGMVHRDIKPQNLMLTPSGQVKILDFGLARFASEWRVASGELREKSVEETSGEKGHEAIPEESDSSGILNSSPLATRHSPLITDTGVIMGTPDYIAPEQARDSRVADIRADIYSLGCTLYDLLAGHAPFPDGNATQKVKAHLERTPAPLRSLRRDVPVGLARVVERMMAKDPAARYQTPAEVAEALKPFIGKGHGALSRKRLVAAACGLAALLLAAVIIYVQTDHGTITIETTDDKIAVLIEKAGGVKIVDQANQREYLLRPGAQDVPRGDYQIEVSDALAGLDFQTKEFKLRRGQDVRLTAKFVAKGEGQSGSGISAADRKRGEERLKILNKIVVQLNEQYKTGNVNLAKVIEAKRDVTKAEVELAESEQEKVKALESSVAFAQNLVEICTAQFKAGVATQVELLQAKADLLEAQGALERAKNRVPTQASGTDEGPLYGGKPASYWLQQSQDASPKFRMEAVTALGALARKDKRLIPRLVEALSDEGVTLGMKGGAVANVAARALGDLGADVVPALMDVLKKKSSPGATSDAAAALARIGPPAKPAIPLLVNLVGSKDAGIRRCAIDALGSIGPEASEALPAIVDELGAHLKQAALEVKKAKKDDFATFARFDGRNSYPEFLMSAMIKISPGIADMAPPAAKSAKGPREFAHNRLAQWEAMREALKKKYPGPTPQTGSTPAPSDNPASDLPGAEAKTLYRGKPAAYWLEQLKDADPKFRAEAVEALGSIAQQNKKLVPVIAATLNDKDFDVGYAASKALGDLGAEAVPALVEVLKDKTSPVALFHAVNAVKGIGPKAKAAVPLLSQALKMDHWGVRRASISALWSIGPDAKAAIPSVVEVLGAYLKVAAQRETPEATRLNKVGFQGGFGRGKGKNAASGPARSNGLWIYESTAFSPTNFPNSLGRTLVEIDPTIQDILPKSHGGAYPYGAPEEEVRAWTPAYEALKKKYPPPPVTESPQDSSNKKLKPQRTGETNGLYRGKPAAYWLEQRKDADWKLRAEAVVALGLIAPKTKDLVPVLVASLDDNDYTVAHEASLALSNLGPSSVAVLLDVLNAKPSAGAFSQAAYALGRIGPEAKAAVPVLAKEMKLTTDKATDWGTAIPTRFALEGIGPAAKPAVPALVESLGAYLDRVKGEPGIGRLAGPQMWPRGTVAAIIKIDPDAQKALPSELYQAGVYRDGAIQDTGELTRLWRQTYEALKKKYPAHP